ncbi:hypothetical protein NQ176_g5351 [Zarea fungicola]|uniref:Uncharacterized protein n=1 Tax=Zarea fungicola TaxID=93591 RepID=A0ACC1N9I9_9HYPO|nr:hypothetical protein NQ176_g5351 [Lecanicillium fungicola]
MESSRPSSGDRRDDQTLLHGDEESQLVVQDSTEPDFASERGLHRFIARYPLGLALIIDLMLFTSFLLTFTVATVIWLTQFMRFILFRCNKRPDFFALLEMMKVAPIISAVAVRLELAAYIWSWLQGPFGRRHLYPWFSFPVYHVFRVIFDGYVEAMGYIYPAKWFTAFWRRRIRSQGEAITKKSICPST